MSLGHQRITMTHIPSSIFLPSQNYPSISNEHDGSGNPPHLVIKVRVCSMQLRLNWSENRNSSLSLGCLMASCCIESCIPLLSYALAFFFFFFFLPPSGASSGAASASGGGASSFFSSSFGSPPPATKRPITSWKGGLSHLI